MHVVAIVSSVIVGVVFIAAGVFKLLDGSAWPRQAADMGVPRPAAVVVPWVELVVGAAGVVAVLLPWSAYVAIVVLLVFTAVIVRRLLDGSRPPCACFGSRSSRPHRSSPRGQERRAARPRGDGRDLGLTQMSCAAHGGARGSSQDDWTTVGPFLAATQTFVVTTNLSKFAAQAEADLRDLRCDPPVSEPVVITAERQPQSWLLAPWTVERISGSAPAVPDANVRVQLVAEVDALALTAGGDGWLPLRAAAVARDGHAVVLAGGHRTGKTMLASRLVRAGWEYVADAVTFLDLEGFDVQPYWRPFTLAAGESGSSDRISWCPT